MNETGFIKIELTQENHQLLLSVKEEHGFGTINETILHILKEWR